MRGNVVEGGVCRQLGGDYVEELGWKMLCGPDARLNAIPSFFVAISCPILPVGVQMAWIDDLSRFLPSTGLYKDLVQPSARQIGHGIESVAKTARFVLAPFEYRRLTPKQ